MDLIQKKQKDEKTGYNINNYVDVLSVVDNFIKTYFLSMSLLFLQQLILHNCQS